MCTNVALVSTTKRTGFHHIILSSGPRGCKRYRSYIIIILIHIINRGRRYMACLERDRAYHKHFCLNCFCNLVAPHYRSEILRVHDYCGKRLRYVTKVFAFPLNESTECKSLCVLGVIHLD